MVRRLVGKLGGLQRISAIIVAWVVAWLVYMIAMVLTVYDGVLSLIVQPFVAAMISTVVVAAGLVIGLLLRIPAMARLWTATPLVAVLLITGSILLMCFGSSWGFTETFTDPETGHRWVGLRSSVALGSYFILVFAIANWPLKRFGE